MDWGSRRLILALETGIDHMPHPGLPGGIDHVVMLGPAPRNIIAGNKIDLLNIFKSSHQRAIIAIITYPYLHTFRLKPACFGGIPHQYSNIHGGCLIKKAADDG